MFAYISAGLGAMLLGGQLYYKTEIAEAKLEVIKVNLQLNTCMNNKKTLESSIDYRNGVIRQNEIDYNKSMVELDIWKNKPDVVRYETIYKYTRDINLSGECNGTIDTLNAISNIHFSDI